jgi:hypothetical protein
MRWSISSRLAGDKGRVLIVEAWKDVHRRGRSSKKKAAQGRTALWLLRHLIRRRVVEDDVGRTTLLKHVLRARSLR